MANRSKTSRADRKTALAIVAHPDDIEFYMAGTLVLLKAAGYAIHYFTIANGSCGSTARSAAAIRRVRRLEARRAAGILGAHYHEALVNDLEIFYDLKTLRRVAALIREVKPRIVLTHAPSDYMEDHMNACRLAVTASFARGMPNFRTQPPRRAVTGDVTLYHAMPHGLRDPLRARVLAGAFVNTAPVHELKRRALAAHKSQRAWLGTSQGMDSYLLAMEDLSLAVGKVSGRFRHAEGWRRHSHLGFSAADTDPLGEALEANYQVNHAYEQALEGGLQPRAD